MVVVFVYIFIYIGQDLHYKHLFKHQKVYLSTF
jgi:hypothetical protein